MAYVVTDACIKDFLCVDECAVDAIAPRAGDPKAAEVSQVFIDPNTCIDCGSCTAVCGQNAILSPDALPADKVDFIDRNAAYFQ